MGLPNGTHCFGPDAADARSDDALDGRVVGDKWQLVSCIGEGSFGEVWIARHVITGGQKALKLLRRSYSMLPILAERFVREAQAAARIDCPHVVSVDDIGHDAALDRTYLVMELLRGESLLQYLNRPPYRMPPSDVLVVSRQIATALDAAHSANIVHRDLKPENVFLSWRADGSVMVKVLDFGIAKLREQGPVDDASEALESAPATERTSGTIGFIGTPGYAAPEQVRDAGAVTPAADVFALGICAYEMLTGSAYWHAADGAELLLEICEGPVDIPSDRAPRGANLPPAFDEWFFRACALDPLKRFATAGEAVTALETAFDLRESMPAPAPRTEVPRIVQISGQRRSSGPHRAVTPPRGVCPTSDPPPSSPVACPSTVDEFSDGQRAHDRALDEPPAVSATPPPPAPAPRIRPAALALAVVSALAVGYAAIATHHEPVLHARSLLAAPIALFRPIAQPEPSEQAVRVAMKDPTVIPAPVVLAPAQSAPPPMRTTVTTRASATNAQYPMARRSTVTALRRYEPPGL